MQSAVLIAAVGILGIVAYGDVRQRHIPNALSLAIAVLGLARIALAQDAGDAAHTLVAALVVFATTFLLFSRGIIGGGDAKLITAMVLIIGGRDLPGFLFLMSLLGGVLALLALARDTISSKRDALRQPPAPTELAKPEKLTVPYGVAVAAAGAITLITAR